MAPRKAFWEACQTAEMPLQPKRQQSPRSLQPLCREMQLQGLTLPWAAVPLWLEGTTGTASPSPK